MKSDVNVMPVAMTDMPPLDRAALGIVAASIPLRAVLALATDLTPDEAYYLSAARLGVTIQDHPPATVWMLQLMESLLKAGPIELRTRLPSLVLGTIGALLLVDIVRLRDGNAACQRWAAILSAWLVLPLAGGFLATPDALLFVATAALLHAEQQRSLRTAIASAAIAVLSGTLAKVIMAPIALAFVLASARR